MKNSELSSEMRVRVLEFLIESAQKLEVPPIVKYSALSLFADRFYRSISGITDQKALMSKDELVYGQLASSPFMKWKKLYMKLGCITISLYFKSFSKGKDSGNWLLQPVRESNLQLFALISIWISNKIHDSHTISVKSLKSLGDKIIKEQHFTTRDFLEAEVILMQVLDFEIGTINIAFIFLEDLLIQLKGVARVGDYVNFEACMDIMDLLYEKEETSILFSSPILLAASILVASYVITVPKQRWEFPVLPWVKFVTSCKEEDILENVGDILYHIYLKPGDSPEKQGI